MMAALRTDSPRPFRLASFPREAYTVGWICALPVELSASRFLFDTPHAAVRLPQHSQQQYVCGTMCDHHVVMACLPAEQPGTSAAAATLSAMVETFPSLQFALMVGIGGGVQHVQLGDVVVGHPDKDFPHGGVVQYDLGKEETDGFRKVGYLNAPGPKVLTALQNVRSLRPQLNRFLDHLESFDSYTNKITGQPLFSRPISTGQPQVHYGLIASGNRVIKNASIRDRMVKEYDNKILCFEMEAAGLSNQLSCLIVRGISDHCDVTKNGAWHQYAAAAAAAWAKEFLGNTSAPEDSLYVSDRAALIASFIGMNAAEQPVRQPPTSSLTLAKQKLWSSRELIRPDDMLDDTEICMMLDRLSSYNHEIVLRRFARVRQEGTCEWLVEHPAFMQWMDTLQGRSRMLNLVGTVGTGKTIAMSYATEHLLRNPETNRAVLHYFFQDPDQSTVSMLKSFTKQLLEQSLQSGVECPVEVFKSIREGFGLRNRDATAADVIDKMLVPLKERLASLTIVIDGFDQLSEREQELLCKYVIVLMEGGRTRLLISSQEENILAVKTVDLVKISLNLTSRADLALLIDARMHQLSLPGRILESLDRQARIREILLRKADGMLLWATLLLDLLGECDTTRQVDEIMTNVPVGLKEVYLACLRRTRRNGRLTCEPRILKWSVIASEPLSMNVWQDLLVTDPETGKLDPSLCLSRSAVIRSGVGLIRWHVHDDSISLIHHTVRQFIFSDALTLLKSTSALWQYFETKLEKSTDDSRRLLPFTWDAHRSQLELCRLQMNHIDYCSGEGMQESTSTAAAAKMSSHEQTAIPAVSSPLAVIKSHLFGKHKGLQHSTAARLRSPARPEQRTHIDRTLFAYAVKTWPESCKYLNDQRDLRGNLARFALRLDRNANIFPWALQQPRTISTLLQSMFAHAVLSNHIPLLDLAIERQDDWPREALDLVLLGNDLMTPLHFAAKFSQPRVFRRLWEVCRHDVKCLRTGKTVLHYAAEAGNSDAVSIILSEPRISLLNDTDGAGRTALHYAAMAGNLDTVELLLSSSKIQPNIADNSEVTALGLAINQGQRAVVSMLLKYPKVGIERAGVSAPSLDFRSGTRFGPSTVFVTLSALEYALSFREGSIALDIVRYRRSAYPYGVQHGTILHMAVEEKAYDLVQAILEMSHMKLRWYDKYQRSPLYHAITNNDTAMTKLFLNPLYIRDNPIVKRKGPANQLTLITDLDELCTFYPDTDCSDAIELFIQSLPAKYYSGPNTAPALISAARSRMKASTMVKLVQKMHSGRHQRGPHDRIPLFWAVEAGNVPYMRMLMAKNPHDLDHFEPSLLESYSVLPSEPDMEHCEADAYCDEDGKGPVSHAAACDRAEALQYLLRTSFARSLNHPDKFGRPPIFYALRVGATDAVRVLLAAPGIDLSIIDKAGKSFVDWATLYGDPIENAAIGYDEAMRLSLALTESVHSVGSQSITKS